jgi:hypothetical protein
MERRVFLGVIAGGLLAAPLAPEAQQAAGKVPLIGLLDYSTPDAARLNCGRPSGNGSESWGTWKAKASDSRRAGHRAELTGSRD